MPLSDNIAGALEVRRTQLDRVEQAQGGIFTCRYFFQVNGAGEAQKTVNFPVRFVEMPSVTNGYSLFKNQNLYDGAYPTATAGVYTWNEGRRPDNGVPYYDGATIIFIVEGPTDVQMYVHVVIEGKAVRSPAGA